MKFPKLNQLKALRWVGYACAYLLAFVLNANLCLPIYNMRHL